MKSIFLLIGFISLINGFSISQVMHMDSSFGKDGIVYLSNRIWLDEISAKVILFQDNLFLFHGIKDNLTGNRLIIVKMNANGQLEKNYFDNGFNITSISLDSIKNFEFRRQSILFQQTEDNKILVFATMKSTNISGTNASLCFKIDYDGVIDTTFGDNGYLWSFGIYSVSNSKFSTDYDGNIYIEASEQDTLSKLYYVEVQKYSPDGKSDIQYGSSGSLIFNVSSPIIPQLAINKANEMFISNTYDSVITLNAFNNLGKPKLNFGLNGYMKFKNFFNRVEQIENLICHEGYIYLAYLGSGLNLYKEYGIIKINEFGNPEISFGKNGLLLLTDTSVHEVRFDNLVILQDYLLGMGRGNLTSNGLYSSIASFSGELCCRNQYHWMLNFDSLGFRPFPFNYSVFNSQLYAIGKFKDPKINSRHIVILNLVLDNTSNTINNLNDDKFIVFPNPAVSYLNLKQLGTSSTKYSIYSIDGKLIDYFISNSRNELINLSIEKYKPGLYWIKAVNSKGYSTKSFIKM